jgi:hypothetical protein
LCPRGHCIISKNILQNPRVDFLNALEHSLAMTVGRWIGSSCAEAFCLLDSGWCSSSWSSISGPGLGSWSHSGSISGHKFMSPSLSGGVGASASAAVCRREENKLGNQFLSESYSYYYHYYQFLHITSIIHPL